MCRKFFCTSYGRPKCQYVWFSSRFSVIQHISVDFTSVVPIVASYRKLVAKAKNRRLSIENFHNRLSVIVLG